jgi:hypothetical protein
MRETSPNCKLTLTAPLLEPDSGAIAYEYVKFEGALDHESVYKGPPNKKMDEAWSALVHSRLRSFSFRRATNS